MYYNITRQLFFLRMEVKKVRNKQTTVYMPAEILQAIDEVYNDLIISEKKNSIILKCIESGLNSLYNKKIHKRGR